ncbi:MAG: GxGYxYP domain-containing protein, partial [Promethearchaeota archaeon]
EIAILYCAIVFFLGIIPLFLPPHISDLTYINWNGEDLSKEIEEDPDYLNDTFIEFKKPEHLFFYSVLGKSFNERVTMITLQGLVNKENTSLFIETTDYDKFWFEQAKNYFNLSVTNLSLNHYWNVISKFKDYIKGLVIYDEELIDTVNVATFLASIEDCVVITADMKENFSNIGIDEIYYDLRNKFEDRVELYDWAWKEYKVYASEKFLFNLDPNKAEMRDYIIASRAFTVWLTPGPFGSKDEIQLFKKILDDLPEDIPVWGWFPEGGSGEYEGIRTVSHSGKYMAVSTWSNPTIYGAFHIQQFNQQEMDFNADNYEIDNKIYITIIVSDGDNIRYCHDTLQKLWQDKNRGEFPVGITISPLLYKLNPIVLKYFYDTASENEYFICPPSGVGYCYPDMNPSITDFLSHSKPILDWCDMDQIWLLNGYEAFEPFFSPEIINAYTSKKMSLSAIYLNYQDFQVDKNQLVNDVPVFHSIFVEEKNEIIGKLRSIESTKQYKREPIFVYIAVNSWNFDFSEMKDTIDELDSDIYKILRPDEFSELFKKYESEKDYIFNEFIVFIITGLIPLICATSLLAIIWIIEARKKKEKLTEEISKESLNSPKIKKTNQKTEISEEKISRFSINLLYLFTDIAFLFAIKYCLYTTNLVTIYFALLMFGIILGNFLKPILDKYLGIRENFLFSILLMGIGFTLFVINFRMVLLFGIPLGIILTQQFQTQKNTFNSNSIGNLSFLYSFVISIVFINLFPRELFDILKWLIATIILSIVLLNLIFIVNKKKINLEPFLFGKFEKGAKIRHYKSILLAFLFLCIFFLATIQERYYYHLIWGLEYFPTKLTLQYAIAATLLFCIAFLELIRIKEYKFKNKHKYIIFLVSVFGYIIIPFIIQGIIIFYLIHFLFIFGLFIIIEQFFSKFPVFFNEKEVKLYNNNNEKFKEKVKGYNMFVNGFIFWFMIMFLLIFIPPVTIVVDTYNILEKIGLIGLNELDWTPFFWMLFYIPSIYLFIVFPITLFCLIYSVIYSIIIPYSE